MLVTVNKFNISLKRTCPEPVMLTELVYEPPVHTTVPDELLVRTPDITTFVRLQLAVPVIFIVVTLRPITFEPDAAVGIVNVPLIVAPVLAKPFGPFAAFRFVATASVGDSVYVPGWITISATTY